MEILSENGYQTHGVGKMHFNFADSGPRVSWGFQSRDFCEECGGDDDFKNYLTSKGYGHVYDPHGVRSEMYYIPQPSQLPEELHNSTWVADRSIDFLKNRDKSRSFLLMTSFIKPHPPCESPTPWNKLYRGPEMPLPKRPQDSESLITYWNKFQNRYKNRDQGVDDNLVRTFKAAYYGAISFVDYNLKRLLKYMEENCLMEDTLIVFSSDHGELLGDYYSYGKRCFFDSAARIPLIMVHPEMDKGICCEKPVSLVDILPTFLQYAGIEPKENYSGNSLKDIVSGSVEREAVYGQYHRGEYGMYMAVAEKYKYIYSAPDNREWLYDLEADPQETRNRMYNPMYGEISHDMKKKLLNYFMEDGYMEPIDGADWRRYPVKSLPDDPDANLLFQDPPESIPDIPGYRRNSCGETRFGIGF